MKTKLCARLLALALTALLLTAILPAALAAAGDGPAQTNPETGFSVYILDDDDLLSPAEESLLQENMYPITEYGNIVFWTTSLPTGGDEQEFAWRKCVSVTGSENSGIFAINMNVRYITFESGGRIYESLTKSFARTVTDNVSDYATDKEYYRCAAEAYRQVLELLQGNSIAQPMKIASYALISVMLGLLLAALFVFGKRQNSSYRKRTTPLSEAMNSGSLMLGAPMFTLTGHNRRYSPPSSSSGGGGGRSGGGGGGGSHGGGSSRF